MTLKESQDNFIELMNLFDSWPDKFGLLIEKSELQPAELQEELQPYRILNCQSRTYFKAENVDDIIHITGWSNSSIMAGIIQCLMEIFNYYSIEDIESTVVDFHIKSGLIDNVTPLRRAAILEMIGRVLVLFKKEK
ncbi:MAG: SufE family protein [Paludibacter sp.]|nr:SufE family protein [Paludibacter sp.]